MSEILASLVFLAHQLLMKLSRQRTWDKTWKKLSLAFTSRSQRRIASRLKTIVTRLWKAQVGQSTYQSLARTGSRMRKSFCHSTQSQAALWTWQSAFLTWRFKTSTVKQLRRTSLMILTLKTSLSAKSGEPTIERELLRKITSSRSMWTKWKTFQRGACAGSKTC